MRVGVIELICGTAPPRGVGHVLEGLFLQQMYSVMPQVVAAWCRRRGHEVTYCTYYGQAPPETLLPKDLDYVFISAHTASSALALALSAVLRRQGIRTVLGGPHAVAFGIDALPYFDVVVVTCDEDTIGSILCGNLDDGIVNSTQSSPSTIPSVAERWPYLRIAAFRHGRAMPFSVIALYASLGCPYTCDFCVDWNTKYTVFSKETLIRDLRFVREKAPGTFVAFHDPNFGVRFDETLDCIEQSGDKEGFNPYGMEASLSILKPHRQKGLRHTNCIYIPTGIESWTSYGAKTGSQQLTGFQKYQSITEHVRLLCEYIPYLQANFILGLDADSGSEPFDLTRDFISEFPAVTPHVGMPIPYGGTPLYNQLTESGRINQALPRITFFSPIIVFQMKHYEPLDYIRRMRKLYESIASVPMMWRRLQRGRMAVRAINAARCVRYRQHLAALTQIEMDLMHDPSLRRFYEGRTPESEIPASLLHTMKTRLGKYFELVEFRKPADGPAPRLVRLSTGTS